MKEEWRNWNGWGFMVSLNLKFRVSFGNIWTGSIEIIKIEMIIFLKL